MKTKILLLTLIGISLNITAQNSFPNQGNIGIGTTNTSNGLLTLNAEQTNLLRLENDGIDKEATMRFRSKNKDGQFFHTDISSYSPEKNKGYLGFKVPYSNNVNEGFKMIINQDGNVGIGTNNPQEKLHINGSIRGNIDNGAVRIKTPTGYIDIGSRNTRWAHIYTDRPKVIFNKDVYTTTNAFSSYNNDLVFKTVGQEKIRIKKDNGFVGIGTNNPTAKLAVNGKIHAKELKIDMNLPDWADFVFEKNYNLPSLQEVEKHIKTKGHLKDIPSAADVAKNGIYIGQMNSKLLQKIEELTLYTIKQDKEIKELKTLVKKLIHDKQ